MVPTEPWGLPTEIQKWGNKHAVKVVYVACIASKLHHSTQPGPIISCVTHSKYSQWLNLGKINNRGGNQVRITLYDHVRPWCLHPEVFLKRSVNLSCQLHGFSVATEHIPFFFQFWDTASSRLEHTAPISILRKSCMIYDLWGEQERTQFENLIHHLWAYPLIQPCTALTDVVFSQLRFPAWFLLCTLKTRHNSRRMSTAAHSLCMPEYATRERK